MTRNYPLNCWYVAAAGSEVGPVPLGRRLLDIPVVLYRRASGEVVAMEDRCIHRAFPLSTGTVEGDRLVCGYHGFTYEPDGLCSAVPSQDNVPQGARVRTFPVREQGPLIWIWLGEAGAAGLRPPPRTPWLTDDGWAHSAETLSVAANYLLLHEHYLDLTNVFVMHPELVPPGLEVLPPLDEVEVSQMSVSYHRTLPAVPLADWEAEATGLPRDAEYVRHEHGTFVSPALHVQRYVIEGADGAQREQLRVHGFTPETPTRTHVFLHIARDYALDRTVVTEHLRATFHEMAMRDAAVVETLQDRLDEETEPRRDVNVKADRAALRARRVALAMVEDETESARTRLSPVPLARAQ